MSYALSSGYLSHSIQLLNQYTRMERAVTRKSGVHQRHHNRQQRVEPHEGKRSRKSKGDDIKVVYISTPMKVKTSASRFRQVVQELTGIDSDVARIMESSNGDTDLRDAVGEGDEESVFRTNSTVAAVPERRHPEGGVIAGLGFSSDGIDDGDALSGQSSDSIGNYDPFDHPHHLDCNVREEGFLGLFDESLLYDSNSQFDGLLGLEGFLL